MSYYDKYGGNPSYAEIHYNLTQDQNGLVVPTVPISNGSNNTIFKKPNFKVLFENSDMFDPTTHRNYFVVITEDYYTIHRVHTQASKPEYDSLQPFDKKTLELVTLQNQDKEYLTLSTDTVNYLKEQDSNFVKAVLRFEEYKNIVQSKYDEVSYYNKEEARTSWYDPAMSYYNSKIADTNQKFKNFVGDFGESLLKLNKPFAYSYDDNGTIKDIPTSIGDFSPYELQEIIDDIFGDVTADDFIPVANEIKYENKEPTLCCLRYCMHKDYFRMQEKVIDSEGVETIVDVPYEQSEQKIEDDIEFQKWLSSDEYSPYVPPTAPQTIYINPYTQMFRELSSIANSPIMYAFEKLKPYLDEYLYNADWVDWHKIDGNSIEIHIDLRNIF